MKKIIQKTMRFGLPALLAITLFAGANTALAGYAFNSLSDDCRTTSVANKTTGEGYDTPCLAGSAITVQPGQEFVVSMYFRNTGDANANQVYAKLNGIDGQSVLGVTTFNGQILVDTTTLAKSQSVNVNFPTRVTATLTKIEFITRSGGARDITSDRTIFSSIGRKIANTIAPTSTDGDYGSIKTTYRVESANSGCTSNCGTSGLPIVLTGGYLPKTDSTGTVNLQGTVSPNGSAACTYFMYANMTNGGSTVTTPTRCTNSSTTGTYNFNEQFSGLSTGSYNYKACAENSSGQVCGGVETFTISRDNYNPIINNQMTVYTDSYSWINQDNGSVTLYGHYNNNTNGSTTTSFEYRRNGESTRSIIASTSSDNSRSFNVSLYSLSVGSYEYRACATGSTNGCGNWNTFYVNQNTYIDNNNYSNVQTLPILYRGQDSATLDGYLNLRGCSSAQTYFQYGRNTSYGLTTALIYKSNSGSISQVISGLSPNTTYYYQAVAQACGTTIYGSQSQFTTASYSVNPPVYTGGTTTIIRNITTATNTGGGAKYLRLTIDNGRDTVVRGDELIYNVEWENISNKDLEDLVLEVSFPEGVQVTYTEEGQIDKKANAVYVNIRDLKKLEQDDMIIRARVNGSFKDNDPITARAIMAFENPENKAQENAIAYDSDSYLSSSSVLGASIFGLDFLPGTLAGWLFIILLLILVVLIIRYATRRREEHHYYPMDNNGPTYPTAPVAPVAPMVTKTTEVEYTPYRPTPKQ
jgi:hypothetical protein